MYDSNFSRIQVLGGTEYFDYRRPYTAVMKRLRDARCESLRTEMHAENSRYTNARSDENVVLMRCEG